jgi:hypothetical protein
MLSLRHFQGHHSDYIVLAEKMDRPASLRITVQLRRCKGCNRIGGLLQAIRFRDGNCDGGVTRKLSRTPIYGQGSGLLTMSQASGVHSGGKITQTSEESEKLTTASARFNLVLIFPRLAID